MEHNLVMRCYVSYLKSHISHLMRGFFKVLLPPLIGFSAFFIAVWYHPAYLTLRLDEIGEGHLRGFMAYYRYFLPLLFVVGLLTQFVIIVPLWDSIILKSSQAKITSFLILCLVCLLLAVAISYPIWDKQLGRWRLIRLSLFMTGVQVIYWVINLLILWLLEPKQNLWPAQEEEEPTE